jgi:hypothetical protein
MSHTHWSILETEHPRLAESIARATADGYNDHEIAAYMRIREELLADWERRGRNETGPTPWRYYYLLRKMARAAFVAKMLKNISERRMREP